MIAEIKGSLLRIEQQEPLIQGTVGQTLGVRLSEEWAGLTVTAVFSAGSVARDVALAGDGLVIPWELLAEPEHTLFLNFHGAAPGGSPVRRTNIASLGTVEKSRSPSGTGPDAPSPSRADQIQALAEQALSLAQGVRSDADRGLFNGRDGLSPSISVSKTGDTAVITVTDASGSASVSVKDGREIDPEKVWGAYPHDTASGAVAHFDDGADDIPVRSLLVGIAPVQSGSGVPSPNNVRPISGWTGVTISQSGEDTSDPETLPISWQSEAGTVYGGTLDVTSGLLTVTHGCVVLNGNANIRTNGITANTSRFVVNISGKAFGRNNFISDRFSYSTGDVVGSVTGRDASNLCEFLLPASVPQTVADGKAWFGSNPTQLVYELAAPVTCQLTPAEVKTLLGVNSIWADTGESSVDYRADPTLYLDRRLTASRSVIAGVESGFTASRNYASGSLLIVGGTLYKTTSAIENGGAIQPGTNAAATTVAEQLLLLAAR